MVILLTTGVSHFYFDKAIATKPDYQHPITQEPLPIVFGHEFGGVVTEIGEGVTRARVGDLVAVRPRIFDGTCQSCQDGFSNVCGNGGWYGLHASGGLAEAAVFAQDLVFRMPAGISPDHAALVEPLAVGWRAVRMVGPLDRESTVLITGGGPIGCAVYLALTAQGVPSHKIVISETAEARRDVLRQLGAALVFSPTDTDIVAHVLEQSGGGGAHVAFDCAGLEVTLNTAFAAVRPRGAIVNLAVRVAPVPLNLTAYLLKEVVLMNSHGHNDEDFEDVISALGSGSMKPDALVTSKIALADMVEQGLQVLHEPGQKDCKILVDVQA